MQWRADNGTATARQGEAEAAAWLARLHADDRDGEDEEGFLIWLDESEAHREAFEKVADAWEIVGGLHAEFEDIAQPGSPPGEAEDESSHANVLGRPAD